MIQVRAEALARDRIMVVAISATWHAPRPSLPCCTRRSLSRVVTRPAGRSRTDSYYAIIHANRASGRSGADCGAGGVEHPGGCAGIALHDKLAGARRGSWAERNFGHAGWRGGRGCGGGPGRPAETGQGASRIALQKRRRLDCGRRSEIPRRHAPHVLLERFGVAGSAVLNRPGNDLASAQRSPGKSGTAGVAEGVARPAARR